MPTHHIKRAHLTIYFSNLWQHIDTAQAYDNERGVGEGVQTAGIDRDKIFVTSKIAAEHKDYDVTRSAFSKLETPIVRILPSFTASSMARHAARFPSR